jgi:hypothetical protein
MKSWLQVMTSVDPDCIPGLTRGLLVTDRDLTSERMFDCAFDGDNIFAPAARSWLPFRIIIHREMCAEFFFMGNLQEFVLSSTQIQNLVQAESLHFITLLTGQGTFRPPLTSATVFLTPPSSLKIDWPCWHAL